MRERENERASDRCRMFFSKPTTLSRPSYRAVDDEGSLPHRQQQLRQGMTLSLVHSNKCWFARRLEASHPDGRCDTKIPASWLPWSSPCALKTTQPGGIREQMT